MPELKHTFQGGKMEKDKDERIVPNGQYREALNISVSTSEDSNVGAAQNILGNICVSQAIRGRTQSNNTITGIVGSEFEEDNSHVAAIMDPQSDMLYRFVATRSNVEGIYMDRIIEYDTTKSIDTPWQEKENAVVVDIFAVKAKITSYEGCGNKCIIKINKNLNQIRWGMLVHESCFSGMGKCTPTDGAFVEEVDYITGQIYLDRDLPGQYAAGDDVTFKGDRNLNFEIDNSYGFITGLNIMDGVLYWTDNHSEPKRIDIERSKKGSKTSLWATQNGLVGRYSNISMPKIDDFNQHTVLVVDDNIKYDCTVDDTLGNCRGGGDRKGGYTQDTVIDTTVDGCMDPNANNYNPTATNDDGSCTYDQNYYDEQNADSGFDVDAFTGAGSANDDAELYDPGNIGA